MNININLAVALTVLLTVTGCGAVDKGAALVTGSASTSCYDGVLYLQFTSGASVAYNKDGTIKTCES